MNSLERDATFVLGAIDCREFKKELLFAGRVHCEICIASLMYVSRGDSVRGRVQAQFCFG